MFGAVLERSCQIIKSNLKHTYGAPFALSLLLLLLTPVIFGLNDLEASAAAVPLEMFVSLSGILLLTPLFLPEQDGDIRELVESKSMPPVLVQLLRLLISCVLLMLFIGSMVCVMLTLNCQIDGWKFFFGTFATAFFLGTLGCLAYAISEIAAVGYMAPLAFYVFQLTSGSKFLKSIYLFSLSRGSMKEKYWIFCSGCVFVAAALLIRAVKKK